MLQLARLTVRTTAVALLGMALLGTAGQAHLIARSDMTISAQLQTMSASDLTLEQCQERLAAIDTMLRAAGYGSARRMRMENGASLARWYDGQRRTTVLVIMDQHENGDTFMAAEVPGLVRWNELVGTL